MIVEIALGVFAGLALFHYRVPIFGFLSQLLGAAIVSGLMIAIVGLILFAPILLIMYGADVPRGQKPGFTFTIGLLWLFGYITAAWTLGLDWFFKKFPSVKKFIDGKTFHKFGTALQCSLLVIVAIIPALFIGVLPNLLFQNEKLIFPVGIGAWVLISFFAVKYWIKKHPYISPQEVPREEDKAS